MKKKSFLLLCGNTNRTRFYLDVLISIQNLNLDVLYYGFNNEEKGIKSVIPPSESTVEYFKDLAFNLPTIEDSLEKMISEAGLSCVFVEDRDVNSTEVLSRINSKKYDYVIFSGYGGQILGQKHFEGKSSYIHCHPGKLPTERGSTTMYYSILNDRDFTVTAFYMTSDIDNGIVIAEKTFPRPKEIIDLDVYGDCGMRAITLKRAINNILLDYNNIEISGEINEEYFVIHPLLKHVSILSLLSGNSYKTKGSR